MQKDGRKWHGRCSVSLGTGVGQSFQLYWLMFCMHLNGPVPFLVPTKVAEPLHCTARHGLASSLGSSCLSICLHWHFQLQLMLRGLDMPARRKGGRLMLLSSKL